jgi:hypothetical protein
LTILNLSDSYLETQEHLPQITEQLQSLHTPLLLLMAQQQLLEDTLLQQYCQDLMPVVTPTKLKHIMGFHSLLEFYSG